MGGLAVEIDWANRISPDGVTAMAALVPHRSSVGVAHTTFPHAALAESRSRQPWDDEPRVAVLGSLAIVGDLRLWNRDGLRSRAGGQTATQGMDDRRLLLTAYERTDIGFLDDVDGDFAFAIWDDKQRRVIAARDRFGAVPLFYEETPSGVRFASEPKQLAATSVRPVQPNTRSVGEYLDDRYRETRFSFFEGINRVRPSMALVADPSRRDEVRYWNPNSRDQPPRSQRDVAAGFRERLVEAVRQRVSTSGATVSHLTGGLDSPSIAAAAELLSERSQLPSPFVTVSAVFPGSAADDSKWIDVIAAGQSFPHQNFEPEVDDIEAFDKDMWDADQPRVHRIRGMWEGTSSIAKTTGADLVLAGSGGDQVLDQDQLMIDRLANGSLPGRWADFRTLASASPRALSRVIGEGSRDALPPALRQALRRAIPRRRPIHNPLINRDLAQSLDRPPSAPPEMTFGYPTRSQDYIVAFSQDPTISWFNEIRESEYASRGLSVSYPFLDRGVVEYVASIPPQDRPLDGRSKTLVRAGFAGVLPDVVLNRRTKTIADDHLDRLFSVHGAQYRTRYPSVTDRALEYLDQESYATMMNASGASPVDPTMRESLWNAWTLMAWLDGLGRYRPSA